MLKAYLEWFGWIAVRRSSFASFCFSSSEALGDRSSFSLSLWIFLELVIWNRKEVIVMNGFGLYFSGGTLTVLYVSSSQSVGCQHNFLRLKVYLVVILLKSRQKGAVALGADAWGSCIKKIRGFWSVTRMTFLANKYFWLRSIPRIGQKSSFSICEYLLSPTGSAILTDVTGLPSCI